MKSGDVFVFIEGADGAVVSKGPAHAGMAQAKAWAVRQCADEKRVGFARVVGVADVKTRTVALEFEGENETETSPEVAQA